jgi:hypothetical protein
MLIFLGTSCFAFLNSLYRIEDDFPLDEPGTTNIRAGAIVEKDGWIYYPNDKDADRLHRRSLDGTIDERLWGGIFAYYINVIDNRIWYIRGAAGGPIYELQRGENGLIYGERKLDSRPCGKLLAVGGYLFYLVYPAQGDRWFFGKLYRFDLRSGEKKLLAKDVVSYAIHEGNIYFGHRRDADSQESTGDLCKMDLSGNGYTVLARDNPYNIEIVDDTVYYARYEDHKMYSIKTDGSERRAFPKDWVSMYVTDKYIYYKRDEGDFSRQRRMNLDGSGDMQIFAYSVDLLDVTGHMILFKRSAEYRYYYVSDLDGNNVRLWL